MTNYTLKKKPRHEPKAVLRKPIGKKQYALVYSGQRMHHEIVGSNWNHALKKAKEIALKKHTGVVITKEVAVISYKRGY